MRRWISVLALMGVFVACGAPRSVVLLGDSITQGVTSEPSGPPFAARLRDSLGEDFEVINIGCNGASSRDWLPTSEIPVCGYAAMVAPNLPADLVVILLGTNDAIGHLEPAPLSAAEFRTALNELIAQLLQDGAEQVMLATPPPNFALPIVMPTLVAYAAEIREICSAEADRVRCGPDLLRLLELADFETGNLHPNASGHAKIADAMHASVLQAIRKPDADQG